MRGVVLDLAGQRFGRLCVVERAGTSTTKLSLWLVRCDCGIEKVMPGAYLTKKTQPVRSCGCLLRDAVGARSTTHEHTSKGLRSRTYESWQAMLRRCTTPNAKSFANYGGRGVTVCDRWNPQAGGSFSNFLADLGERPQGRTLDRLDPNGNYEPSNCRWATTVEQRRNRRDSRGDLWHLEQATIYRLIAEQAARRGFHVTAQEYREKAQLHREKAAVLAGKQATT